MRLLLDENVHTGLLRVLAAWGHDATRVPAGWRNGRVAQLASDEGRALLTHDSDFANWEQFPPARHPGMVWVNMRTRDLAALSNALSALFRAVPPEGFQGKLFVVEDGGFREVTG